MPARVSRTRSWWACAYWRFASASRVRACEPMMRPRERIRSSARWIWAPATCICWSKSCSARDWSPAMPLARSNAASMSASMLVSSWYRASGSVSSRSPISLSMRWALEETESSEATSIGAPCARAPLTCSISRNSPRISEISAGRLALAARMLSSACSMAARLVSETLTARVAEASVSKSAPWRPAGLSASMRASPRAFSASSSDASARSTLSTMDSSICAGYSP